MSYYFIIGFFAVAVVTLPARASAWWDSDWLNRKKITINNAASSENLANFPLHVGLNGTLIDYAKTLNAGEDIRFVDADDTTELSYEIESWNESATSTIWVEVPQIASASTTDHIWMYYNNTGAADGQSITGTWEGDFIGVWHLNETSGANEDSTTNNIDSTTVDVQLQGTAVGKMNGADDFERSSSDGIRIDEHASLDLSADFTLSGWIKQESQVADEYHAIVSLSQRQIYFYAITDEFFLGYYDGTYNECRTSAANLSTTNFNYVTAVLDSVNDEIKLYLNGALIDSSVVIADGCAPQTDPWQFYDAGDSGIGVTNEATDNSFFDGIIDEARVSDVVRSADWIEAEYNFGYGGYLTFASEESENTTPTTPSSLGPAALVAGSYTASTTPNLTFTQSDSDGGDTLKYQVQIDNTADFSSPVVDYTSALQAQGATSFTVGQAAGSGFYTTGSLSQTLSDASYYWRVRSNDGTASSTFATANSGNISFIVDATAPSPASFSSNPAASTPNTVLMTATTATDAGSGSVEYLFSETTGGSGATSSGWQSSASFTDDGLSPCTTYSYTVTVRDALANTSSASGAASVRTPCLGGGSSGSTAFDSAGSNIYPTGTLVKYADSPKVYYVNGNIIQHIPDEATFIALGFSWSDILLIPLSAVIVEGSPLTSLSVPSIPPMPASYRLIKYAGDPKVYLLVNDTKYWIASEAVFNHYGYDWGFIELLPDRETYRTGLPISA